MPKYIVGNRTFAIPDDKVEAFEKRYPEASVELYSGGDSYTVPVSKAGGFKKKYKDWSYDGQDGTTVERRGQDDATMDGAEKVQVSRPNVDAEVYLAGRKSLQQRVEEARRAAEAAKDASNGYAAPWQVSKTEAPEEVARPKQMTPWDVERAAFEEEEEKRIDYRPRVARTEREVYDNYMERFGLTEEGKKLNDEYKRAVGDIGANLWKEWMDTDEYRKIVASYNEKAKKAKTNGELEEVNRQMNDELSQRFELEYGERYRQETEPYDKALHGAMQQRYGKQIHAENMKLEKAAQGGIVRDMTAKIDNMLVTARAGRDTQFVGPYLSAARGRSAMTDEERTLNAAKRQLEEAEETINAVKNDSGFLKGLSDKSDWEKYTFGMVDTEDAIALRRALTKSEEGKALTEAEQALLDATLTNMTVQGYYSNELNTSYGTMGAMTAESIPFMLEFLINPISGSGNAMAKGLLKYGMKKFGLSTAKKSFRNRAIKTAARLVGDATAAVGMTGTSGTGRVAAGTLERLNDNYDIKKGEDMSAYAVRNDENMGAGEAFARSLASNFLENQSEMVFKAFPGVGKKLGEYAKRLVPGGASEMLTRLVPDKISNLWKQSRINPYMKGLKNRVQIGGIGEEYLEEVYNNFANVAIGEMSMEDATSLQNNVDTFLGLVPTQLFFSAMGVGGYALERRKNTKAIERYRGMLTEDVQREVEAVANEAIGNPERLNDYVMEVMLDGSIVPEQKSARIALANELNKRNLLDGIDEAKQTEEVTPQEVAVEAGISAETPEEKHAINKRYENAVTWRASLTDEDGQLGAILDMEDRYAAVSALEEQGYGDRMQEAFDYWAAMDAYEGMAIGAANRVDEAVADANMQAARNAHINGRIYEATTADRGVVYVKSGNIAWNKDGTINVALSDPQLFVVNEEGQVEMMSPRNITAVAERGTLQAQREYNNTTLREQLEKEEADAVELNPNTPPVAPGLTYVDEQGNQMVVMGVQDGVATVASATDKDAVPAGVPVDEIRGMLSARLDAEEGARRESDAAGTATPVDGSNDGNLSPKTGENEGAPVGGIEQSVSEEGQNEGGSIQTALERVPKDAQGNLLYEEADADTAWDAIVEEAEGDEAVAHEAVADIVNEAEKELKDAEKALKKAQEAKPEVKGAAPTMAERIAAKKQAKANTEAAQKVVDAAKARLDKWKDIAGTVERRNAAVEAENKRQAEEAARVERERMEAEEIARRNAEEADKLMAIEPMNGIERAAQAIGTGEVSLLSDSYKRETGYGDKEVKGMFGTFAGKDKGGKTIEEAAEYLVAQDEQGFFGGDVQEARNAILDVLQGVRKKSELRNYIANQRKAAADEMARAEREAYEAWTMGSYGMTPEEYEDYEESVYRAIQEKAFTEEEYIEYISNFADENLNDNQYGLESNEQSGTDELREGSGTVLPSEQSVQAGRTGGIEEESSEADVNINSADAASQEEAGEIRPVGRGAFGNEQGREGISSEKNGENGLNVGANRLVSDARYAELRERMRKKLGGQMNIGIDPEILAIGTEMAVYHLEKGARKFVDYAKAMIADLGDAIRPYLKAFYNGARELPEVVDGGLSAEMTTYEEVQKIDVANLGKRVVNPVDAAETIVKEDVVEKQAKVAKERVKNSRGKKQDGGMLGLFDVQEVTDGDLAFTEVEQPKSEKKRTKKGKQSEKPSDEKSPVWQYSVYVDKQTGRTTLRRDDVSGVYPIGDARFTVEAASPEEMLDILRNPLNGMQEVLDAVGVTLENKIATRKLNEAVGYTGADGVNGLNKTEANGLDEIRRAFADAVARDMLEALESGVKPYRSIVDLRKRAQSVGMEVDSEGRTDILLQELVENGLVKAAREVIAKSGRNSKTSFDLICKLYDMQPTIGARSSERVKMQQYSTPLPMAWVANRFAMAGKSSGQVLEPTAGNGMLVFTVPVEQVHANELDETRLDNLREQGFAEVTNQDANKPFSGEYDVLIANPPFGQRIAKEYDGKLIAGLDPQITVNALQNLKDDGRAAIIIGGNMEYADNGSVKGFKPFFTYLYDHYNVKGIVDMDGKLYQKQGTTFPTRMILIEGRRSAEERAQSAVYPPVKDRAIRKAETFEDLYEIVNEIINSKEKTNGTEILRSQGGQLVSVDNQSSGRVDRRGRSEQSATDVEERRRREQRTSEQEGVKTDGRTDVSGGARPDMGTGETRNEPSRNIEGGSRGVSASDVQRVEGVGTSTERVGLNEPQSQEKRTLDEGKLPYRPHNTAFSLQSVAPAAMVEAMDKMLAKIEEKHGSIDEFVRSELGYDTIEEAHNALAAEQMDSVAMAIYQMKNGQAMIIGDQTGVGKGRQMAALIRWAVMRGEKPVFITQKADLFSDIYRDLVDVGSGDLRPFIFNSDGAMVDNNGVVVHKPLSSSEMAKVFQSGRLPDGYDFAVLTYSQVNTGDAISQEEAAKAAKESGKRGTKKSKSSKEGKATPKATFLRAIANDNYLFLDESHTAAGSSNTGAYLQSILKTAKAATFASATFAKRPDTMPLYAIRTAMSKAKIDTNELISIIEKGGVTLQEIMSRALTEAGQMVRRERDMSDVRTDWKTITDEATVKRARENYDRTIEAFNAIIRFQEEFVTPMIEELDEEIAAMAETAKVKKGTERMGVENVPFASKTYNYTKQLMLALKVDAIVDEVVAEIEAGRHPVIALESTMEASIKDYVPGSVIDEPTFSASLLRGLDTVMQYTVTDENGKESHRRYSPEQLGEEGERAYYELQDFIREATSDIFISPLDAIIEGLKQRGYKVGELTGRSNYVERNDEGQVVVRRRTDKDKKRMQREFNNGTLDVLILNKSASTGISLHASSRFSDQRQRSMIIAQPLSDINDYMQMIGRIDRTGQVHRGYYINLGLPVPAENRFLMMLSTKLKSLNANTTTSQDSESNDVEAPDLLNKYGSKVVVEYLRDNKGIYEKMGDPLKSGKGRVSSSELDEYVPQEDDARKITGYVALLSTSEQDAFYDDVVRRYKELIKYLDDTGSNDLKITVMPLRAQTIDKRVSSEGVDPNGENPFASNAYVERVEMDVLRKPMKASEVQAVMESLAKGEEPAAHVKSIAATVRQEVKEKLDAEDARYERAKERMAENVEKQAAKINGQKKLTEEQKRSSIERVREEERERVELQHNEAVKRIGLTRDNFLQRLNMFKVGNTYMVPDNLETPTFMFSSPAIFCGYKAKDSNLTPSTTLAVFATLDGRRRVEVKLSEINPLRVISDATSNNWDAVSRTNLDTWDSMRPTSTRKEGYIMTGNILQAVADTKDENGHYPGQLISFTDMEGNVRDGILMPDKWDTSQLKSGNVPLNARMAQIKAGDWVESHDGKVSLSKGYGSSYHVTVPKTKKSGGAYYLNEDLLDLVDGHVFYPWRGEFRADIPAENIEAAVNILSNLGVKVKGETGKEETRFREGEGEMTDRDVVMQSDMYSAFLGKPRYSGKRMRDYVARQRGKMVDRVKDMAKKMGVEVTIINSVTDAPKDVKRILRKHPKSKGWYDVATGKVVVIMPNHGSVEDVNSTVLHECVAHYGLRKLFGKRFDKFLDNVYMNADPDVFKRISELAQKNGWDYRVATEEYLASLAEDTNFENARNSGWFQRIKDFFIDMMHALGLDYKGVSLGDNELRYILWRSYENMVRPGSYLNKFVEAGDMSMQKRLKVGDYQALVDIQRLGNVDLSGYVPMVAEGSAVGDEGLRFRVEEEDMERAIAEYRKEYKSAPLTVLYLDDAERVLKAEGESKADIREIMDMMRKRESFGVFVRNSNRIYIFADIIPHANNVIPALKHENAHASINKLFPRGKRIAEFNTLYDAISKNVVGKEKTEDIRTEYSDYDERSKKEEVIAYAVETYSEDKMLSILEGKAKELYDELLTDNKKEYGISNGRRTESNPDAQRGNDRAGQRDIPSVSEKTKKSGRVSEKGYDSSRRGDFGRRILDEVIRLEEELGTAVNAIDSFDALPEGRAKDAIAEGRKVLGWYQDGRVYVYMPNARSAGDVRATVYHEVVGHLGLREMLGDRFNAFLDRVYMNLPADVRAELNNRAMRKGWDFREATEEYMAELAERFARGEKVSGLRKVLYAVRDAVVKALRSLGIDLGFEMSDNYLMYVLWASKQNLKPSNVMGRIADRYMRNVLNVEGDVVRPTPPTRPTGTDGSNGLRFREVEPEDDVTRMTREAYEKNLKSLSYRLREGFQDSMLSLKELQDAIVKTLGHDLEEYENAYVEENHLSSKNTAEFDYLTKKLYKPLIEVVYELMKGGNMSYQDVLDYLNAKHGIERNRDWAVRDALNAMRKEAEDDAQRQVVDDMEQSYYDYRDAMYEELENGYIDFDQYCDLMDAKARDYVPGYDGKEDYSGLSSAFGEEGDVDAEWYDRARGYVRNVEDAMPAAVEKLWEAVRSVNQFSLDKAKDSGTMSVADHKKISNQFKWYVPLRGFDETTAEEAYEYFSRDSATGAYQSTIKAGRGRKSQAADMIATMMNVAQSTIMHGNKNQMKQKFLNLVMNSKTGLVTVLDNWYVNTGTIDDPIWEPAYPDFKPDATAEEIAQAIDDFKADMEAKEKQGLAKKARGGERIPYRTTKKNQLDEHIVIAKRNGQEFRMVLNGNPRAAQALNGLMNPDTAEGTLEKIAHRVNPILAPLFTTQNPTFIARNLIRDSFMSGSSVMIKESFWYGQRFRGNQLRSLGNIGRLIKKYEAGTLDESVPMERYFKEFIENGAETGYSQLWSVDKFKAEIEKDLKRMEGGLANGTINGGKALLDGLAFVNRCAEDMNRFAVYMTSRESGRSIQRSVHDAKEITVNFNKKGAGAKAGGWIGTTAQIARTFYLFFNAGIQGLNNYARMAKEHPAKFAGVVGLFAGLGALMPLANALMIAMFGDDDDEDTYNDLPEWIRRNNICLYVPFAGKKGTVITLPLPIELRALYGLGEAVTQISLGHETAKEGVTSVVNQFFEMMPVNPVSSGGAVQAFTPTAFQPIVQHVQNKDWTGTPIYKKSDFNKRYPEYTQAYKGTPQFLIQTSKFLNDLTGGNEVKRGWLQLNPGLAANYISGYTGGLGTTLMDLYKSFDMFLGDEPFDLRNMPVVKAVAQTPTERNKYALTNKKYSELTDELKQFEHEKRGYDKLRKSGGDDASKYMELFKELHDTKKWERMNSIKVMQKQIKELQELGDKLPKEKEADIEKRINELKKMTVERWYE